MITTSQVAPVLWAIHVAGCAECRKLYPEGESPPIPADTPKEVLKAVAKWRTTAEMPHHTDEA